MLAAVKPSPALPLALGQMTNRSGLRIRFDMAIDIKLVRISGSTTRTADTLNDNQRESLGEGHLEDDKPASLDRTQRSELTVTI